MDLFFSYAVAAAAVIVVTVSRSCSLDGSDACVTVDIYSLYSSTGPNILHSTQLQQHTICDIV